MGKTIHLTVNSPHALSIIKSLEKMGAVHVLEEEDGIEEVSEELKGETRKRLEHLKNNPETVIRLQQFKNHILSRLTNS